MVKASDQEVVQTVASRLEIGFPEKREYWNDRPAEYDAHSLRIAGHPVMMDWESGYMDGLARVATSNGGSVLEVGFGMGISAKAIQRREVERHTIVECHPDVIFEALSMFRSEIAGGSVSLMTGFWQAVTPTLRSESFDGILFDTYPLTPGEIHRNHFDFFAEAFRLLKVGGVFTYYSDEAKGFSAEHVSALEQAGFSIQNVTREICKVNPPDDCEYWAAKALTIPRVQK